MLRVIRINVPLYHCDSCGCETRYVNVVSGHVLCHNCTILKVRSLDSDDFKEHDARLENFYASGL